MRLPLLAAALMTAITVGTLNTQAEEQAPDLPPVCLENAGHAAMGHADGAAMAPGPSSDAHDDLMAGMDRMNTQMMAGGTASDIDVAFACSMIAHHRGAIDMALAEAIIGAQELEIDQMLEWLASR